MSNLNNPYVPQKAVIEKIIPETPGIKTFVLRPEAPFEFICGQFAELTLPGIGEGPFAMSSPSTENSTVSFTINNVGYMTSRLHTMKKGDYLGIRGPYGNGFTLDDMYGKEVVLVAGGVGFPPARALLYSLLNEQQKFAKIVMCYGARTPEDVVYKYQIDEFRRSIDLRLTVDKADDSWKGGTGVVTTLLDDIVFDKKNVCAVVIGPPVMMKYATKKLLELGVGPQDIILSMERKMYCGIGQCRHCMIDSLFICKDGPVFKYHQLQGLPDIWE